MHMSSLPTENLINKTRYVFAAMFFAVGIFSKIGQSAWETWGGIIAASALLLLIAFINQIFIWFKKVSTTLIYISVTVEISLVTMVKFFMHYDPRVGWGMTIKEPATFVVYFLFIIMAALRYDKKLNIYMAVFSMTSATLLLVLALTVGGMHTTSDVTKFFDKDTIRLSSEVPKILFLGAFVFFVIKMTNYTNKNTARIEEAERTASTNFMALKNILDTVEQTANELLSQSNRLTESSDQIDGVLNQHGHLLNEVEKISKDFTESIEDIRTRSNFQYNTVEKNFAMIKEISDLMERINSDSSSQRGKAESALKLAIMNEDNITKTIAAITGMKENSKKIEEISKTISEIADKTNLLSLNAAIESARAGEHGKGFAVVSDEISKLATMSIDSSKEIAKIIKSTVSNIENSSAMIGALAMNLGQIVSFVKENSTFMAQLNEKTLNEFNETRVLYSSSLEVDQAAKQVIDLSSRQTEFVKKIVDLLQNMNSLGRVVSNSLRELHALSIRLKERSGEMKVILEDASSSY
jgi:methyl-accepting chemotaxis protein